MHPFLGAAAFAAVTLLFLATAAAYNSGRVPAALRGDNAAMLVAVGFTGAFAGAFATMFFAAFGFPFGPFGDAASAVVEAIVIVVLAVFAWRYMRRHWLAPTQAA